MIFIKVYPVPNRVILRLDRRIYGMLAVRVMDPAIKSQDDGWGDRRRRVGSDGGK